LGSDDAVTGQSHQVTPKIDPKELAQNFGFAMAFLNSNSELKRLFNEAVAQSWTPDRFIGEIRGTRWYQQHSEAVRNAIMQKTGDPTTWLENVAKMKAQVVDQWNQLYGVGTLNDKQVTKWAEQAQTLGWDSSQLLQHMAAGTNYQSVMESSRIGGTAAETLAQIEQSLGDYGVGMTQATRDRLAQQVITKQSSLGAVQAQIRNQAMSTYTAFAPQLEAGQTMSQIADPYRAKMADLLEISPEGISLRDPMMQKALTNVDPKTGQHSPLNVNEFAQQVRQDSRWQYTANARSEAAGALRTLGQSWGLSS
jgi:hypothetical protein